MMFRNSLELERLARIQAVTKDLENNLQRLENLRSQDGVWIRSWWQIELESEETGTYDAQSPETRFSLSDSRVFKQ